MIFTVLKGGFVKKAPRRYTIEILASRIAKPSKGTYNNIFQKVTETLVNMEPLIKL